jgi:hypothetical protein
MKKNSIQPITDSQTALSLIHMSSLKGYITEIFYSDLVNFLGEPTFSDTSGDSKVNKEWVVKFKNEYGKENIFTIYDWKTYDVNYTINELKTWNVGGHTSAFDFIDFIETKIKNI